MSRLSHARAEDSTTFMIKVVESSSSRGCAGGVSYSLRRALDWTCPVTASNFTCPGSEYLMWLSRRSSCSPHEHTLFKALGVNLFHCGHGKWRRDRYQQNVLFKFPLVHSPGAGPGPWPGGEARKLSAEALEVIRDYHDKTKEFRIRKLLFFIGPATRSLRARARSPGNAVVTGPGRAMVTQARRPRQTKQNPSQQDITQ